MTRFVLSVMVALLVVSGAVSGVAVAIAVHSHHGVAVAVLAGVGAALGAWAAAALLGLLMEIADSLRELVWASREASE